MVIGSGEFGIALLLGRGDGTFETEHVIAPQAPQDVVVEDVSGDGILDIIVMDTDSVSALLGHGDGSFQEASSLFAGESLRSIVLGDVKQ